MQQMGRVRFFTAATDQSSSEGYDGKSILKPSSIYITLDYVCDFKMLKFNENKTCTTYM